MSEEINYPWLTFKLNNQPYCITSRNVLGIRQLEEITPMPEASAQIAGLMMQNDMPIPVINLRVLLGFKSMDDTCREQIEDIESYKKAHLNWVDTFERCTNSGEAFPLETNPHKCAFGLWLDSYNPQEAQLRAIIEGVRAPHEAMHKLADNFADMTPEEREAGLIEVSRYCHEEIVPVLNHYSQAVQDGMRTLVVVLEDGEHLCAILVDDILSTMNFSKCESTDIFAGLANSRFISNVMRGDDNAIYLELSPQNLLSFAANVQQTT